MTAHEWPPLRLDSEKVTLMFKTGMHKAGPSTIILAALLATGCVGTPRIAHSQASKPLPAAPAQTLEFHCDIQKLPEISKLIGYNDRYCIAATELDRNPKTTEIIAINPGLGGTGGDPMAILQKSQAGVWTRIDNDDQFAFMEGLAIRQNLSGWASVITNYSSGRPENVLNYQNNKYLRVAR